MTQQGAGAVLKTDGSIEWGSSPPSSAMKGNDYLHESAA